jgi:hypothetical protein
MRVKTIAIFGLMTIFIASCQKEIDWGSSTDTLLRKIESRSGSDSSITTFSYDGSRRLISEVVVGASGGISIDQSLIINRDASGIITTTVQKSALLTASGIDSLLIRYYYNTGTSRYTAAALDVNFGGFGVVDSAVYTYDGAGRITSEMHYIVSGILPTFQALENQFTYSGNGMNLVQVKQLSITNPGDPLTDLSTQAFTFDTKTDPLIIKNEAILLARYNFYSGNNITKEVFSNVIDPSQDFTQDITFKYNLAGKPDSSFSVRTPGTGTTASRYYYQ